MGQVGLSAIFAKFPDDATSRRQHIIIECLGSAISGLMRRSKLRLYSITSSARASNKDGAVKLRMFAVLTFIASSNLSGRSIDAADSIIVVFGIRRHCLGKP